MQRHACLRQTNTINLGRRSPKESLVEKKNTDGQEVDGLMVNRRDRMWESRRADELNKVEARRDYGDSG
ncbi:hypothetical protein RRF57_003639 [Xylaria bambusicola]|uniref:Uncharacterized protein n=1 Tax=Xylaria bambusicola TaxID=326684 RepID=A0AAN7UF61_9PEZI